ncbi:restriction endonuclease subunit S [Aeromonas salmonicida]|uniref:restriction endonuclease subunit S n=1 Tax=Aeromonas salmonicida TaxID=645 RepID=UPI003D01A547
MTLTAMPKYDTYKNSGVEWLGDIPDHWHVIRLKNAALINPVSDISKLHLDDEICFLPMEKVGVDGTVEYDLRRTLRSVKQGFTSFQNNDVIIAKITPCFENGKGAYLNNMPTKFGYGSTEFHVIRAYESFEPAFLYYLSKSHSFMDFGEKMMTGSAGQKRVPTDFIAEFRFSSPSFIEQTVIANFLDKKTTQIDEAITIKERQIALLNERKQILIQQAVTKGFNPCAPLRDSGIEWIGKIPEHWECKKVKHLFRLAMEQSEKNNNHELLSVYSDIGVKPRKELEERGNKASTTDGYWIVKKGDIVVNKLLAWMGAIGLSEYDGVTSPAYDILRPEKRLNGYFYHYLFRSKFCSTELKRHSRGIMDMRLRLYFDKFGVIEVPYPPKEEQDQIIEKLNELLSDVNNGINVIHKQIKKYQEYKATLINSAVTGKIKMV